MRGRYYLTAGLLLLTGCGQAADAVPPHKQPQPPAAASSRADVAGVALGDSVQAATATLRQRGFDVVIEKGGYSFGDLIESARAKAAGRFPDPKLDGPQRLHARKGVETIEAEIDASPEGGYLKRVIYSAPSNGRPAAEMAAIIIERYGSGRQVDRRLARICARTDTDCSKSNPQQNYIQYSTGDKMGIALLAGVQQRIRWKDEFDAAMRKRLRPVPSSF